LDIIVIVIAVMGIAVIVWGAVVTFFRMLVVEYVAIAHRERCKGRESLRVQFGCRILLGLEFLIAADIIRTVMEPTLTEIAILASIVAIRTIISFFLDREIARAPADIREE